MALLTMVQVQLAVLGGALAAVLLGLLGYLLRYSLGLVKMPPPEEESEHH